MGSTCHSVPQDYTVPQADLADKRKYCQDPNSLKSIGIGSSSARRAQRYCNAQTRSQACVSLARSWNHICGSDQLNLDALYRTYVLCFTSCEVRVKLSGGETTLLFVELFHILLRVGLVRAYGFQIAFFLSPVLFSRVSILLRADPSQPILLLPLLYLLRYEPPTARLVDARLWNRRITCDSLPSLDLFYSFR